MLTMRHRTTRVLIVAAALIVPFGASPATAGNLPEIPPGCWLGTNPTNEQVVVVCPHKDPGTSGTPGGTAVRQPSEEELKRMRDVAEYCDRAETDDANRQVFGLPSDLANNARYQSYCTPGTGDTPGDAATAAQQVVAGMNLPAPTIGIAPRPTTVDPNSVGLVGVPNYMWVTNPEIFGTITDTATLGGWTITVTATVDYVDWDMGDKQVIRCTGPGTAYEARFDLDPSPDCGHVYSQQGYYTVTATAHWRVDWVSTDQTGTLTTDQTASVPLVIGEAFAVRRK